MKLVSVAVDHQQAAADPTDRISGCSRSIAGADGEFGPAHAVPFHDVVRTAHADLLVEGHRIVVGLAALDDVALAAGQGMRHGHQLPADAQALEAPIDAQIR